LRMFIYNLNTIFPINPINNALALQTQPNESKYSQEIQRQVLTHGDIRIIQN